MQAPVLGGAGIQVMGGVKAEALGNLHHGRHIASRPVQVKDHDGRAMAATVWPLAKYCVRVRRMLTGTRAPGVTRRCSGFVNKFKWLSLEIGGRWKHPRGRPYEVKVATEKAHETGLAGRYANAIFELAQEQGLVDAVAADFAALKSAIAASSDLGRLVKSPLFGNEVQARALKPVLDKMGVNPLTTKSLLTLTGKRRLFALEGVIAAFDRLVAKMKGEVQAQVISAHALSSAQTAELKSVLKARLGREPRLDTRVDPTLLGGLIVKVGSRMIDSSIRTKLAGIRAAMRGN